MTPMDMLFVLILAGGTLIAVRSGMITRLFNNSRRYNNIVSDLQSKVTRLEKLAVSEEKKADKFIQAHLRSAELGIKARATAGNIGKLIA